MELMGFQMELNLQVSSALVVVPDVAVATEPQSCAWKCNQRMLKQNKKSQSSTNYVLSASQTLPALLP